MGLVPARYAWFDGRYVPHERATVPITTHAIHYGTSAFEGIRGYWNGRNINIFRLGDHIRRLRRSGQYYGMRPGFTDGEISGAIVGLFRKNRLKKSCYIRPFYFVGEHGIDLHVTGRSPVRAAVLLFPMGDFFGKGGITTAVASWRKFSDLSTPPQAKMGGNYLNSIIAVQEAKRAGADEAILLDHRGNVSEGSGENVFIVRDGRLATPPISSSALDGITRESVMRIAADLDLEVAERDIPRSELHAADEVFLTGTAAEVVPVRSVDAQRIGSGRPGPVTKKLMGEYSDIVMGRNGDYAHWLTPVY